VDVLVAEAGGASWHDEPVLHWLFLTIISTNWILSGLGKKGLNGVVCSTGLSRWVNSVRIHLLSYSGYLVTDGRYYRFLDLAMLHWNRLPIERMGWLFLTFIYRGVAITDLRFRVGVGIGVWVVVLNCPCLIHWNLDDYYRAVRSVP